jgi:hypothetical protein
MVNEEEVAKETSPDEVWEAVDSETRERVIDMFLHLGLKFITSQGAQVQPDDIERCSMESERVMDDAG